MVAVQRPECGQDGRISLSLVSGLQLHVLAVFLAVMHRQIDVMRRIGFSARYATTSASGNHADDMAIAIDRKPSGNIDAVQNPQERAVKELGFVEISCRKLLETMQQVPQVQEDWMALIEGTVQRISSCRRSLRANQRTTAMKHGLRDATMKGCVTPVSSSSESSIVQSYLEMMFTEDMGPRQHRIQSISLMSASSPEVIPT